MEFLFLLGWGTIGLVSYLYSSGWYVAHFMAKYHPVLKLDVKERIRNPSELLLAAICGPFSWVPDWVVYYGNGWKNPFTFKQPDRGHWENYDKED